MGERLGEDDGNDRDGESGLGFCIGFFFSFSLRLTQVMMGRKETAETARGGWKTAAEIVGDSSEFFSFFSEIYGKERPQSHNPRVFFFSLLLEANCGRRLM